MNVWWCNQGGTSWHDEYRAGVVSASSQGIRLRFRQMVGEVKKGDIILHYRKSKQAIVAISRARADAVESDGRSNSSVCLHGAGWGFKTKYEMLDPPARVKPLAKKLLLTHPQDGPIQELTSGGFRIRQDYFMRFSEYGLSLVVRAARATRWPDWTIAAGGFGTGSKQEYLNSSLTAIEGIRKETKVYLRGRSRVLRDAAMRAAEGRCSACDRDFSKLLEGEGVRALHAHHKKQLSSLDAPEPMTISDIAIVCATCHSLIHANPKKALSVAALKRLLQREF